ncbi:MAG: hypothetical protein COA79_24550 [Planctomycetota bacterium]|nr:MAG: hypothetical protein COA79_24550 [Planctomycetota bacterium]
MKKYLDNLIEFLKVENMSGEEKDLVSTIVDKLIQTGLDKKHITIDDANEKIGFGNSGNLIITIPGNIRGYRLLFSAHLDSVKTCKNAIPIIKKDYIESQGNTGLGGDNKAGCAIIFNLLQEIIKNNLPHPPLTFVWMVQEELGVNGSRHINSDCLKDPKMGFNFDGSCDLVTGATGGDEITIKVYGKSSHAGINPEKGINALVTTSTAIANLKQEGWLGLVKKNGVRGSSNLIIANSSKGINVIPDQVTLKGEIRSYSSELRTTIYKKFEQAFLNAIKNEKNTENEIGSLLINSINKYESFILDDSLEVVRLSQKIAHQLSIDDSLVSVNHCVDANWLNEKGIPTITIRNGNEFPHTTKERINIKKFLNSCEFAHRIIATFL